MEILDYNLCDEMAFNNVEEFNCNENFGDSELLILHVNIRSVSKNLIDLEALINTFLKKPDVLICSEAFLKDKTIL